MKILLKPLLFFVISLISYSSFCQNKYNSSSFNESRPTYVSPPVEDYSNYRRAMETKNNMNKNDYYSFIDKILNEMGDDQNSIQYQSRFYALKKFINKMSDSVKNEKWAYMGNDLAKAKSEYYDDFIDYINNSRKRNNSISYNQEKFVKINSIFDGKCPLRTEPNNTASKILDLKSEWNLTIIKKEDNYYKVKFNLSGSIIEGYVHESYCE